MQPAGREESQGGMPKDKHAIFSAWKKVVQVVQVRERSAVPLPEVGREGSLRPPQRRHLQVPEGTGVLSGGGER